MIKKRFAYTLAEVFSPHPTSLRRIAYTLAEVVIVMFIIAVVVGVSIRTAKAKFDTIIPVTYYSAFTTLQDVIKQMQMDYRADIYTSGLNDGEEPVVGICGEGNEEKSDGTCGILGEGETMPRYASRFCELFASYVNTTGDECEGDEVSGITAGYIGNESFKDVEPDIVLHNGMKVYNLSKKKYLINIVGKSGYVVFIDIDGDKGTSTVWEDIFPFYVLESGEVIPAYNRTNGAGGSDKNYLQTSLSLESVDDIVEGEEGATRTERRTKWLTKSVSYRESACKMGVINQNTVYCNPKSTLATTLKLPPSSIEQVTKLSDCSEDTDCRINIIKPLKFIDK